MTPRPSLVLLAVTLVFLAACSTPVTPTPVSSPAPADTPTTTLPFAAVPSPTATSTSPSPTPSPTATPLGRVSSVVPNRDLYALTARLVLKNGQPIPHVVNPQPVSYPQGRQDTFQVTDIPRASVHTVTATLQLVTPHAYWYVDNAVPFSMSDLQHAANAFETGIYPRITKVFGTELLPGIDNDVHLTILHTPLHGVSGYFSGADEYPVQLHPYSNQREMFYMDTSGLPLGSDAYLGTLAHEFTHAVQFRANPAQDTWINEGLAEFGKELAGYTPTFRLDFAASQPTSLVNWPLDLSSSVPYYGGANMFMDYLAAQFGSDSLSTLMDAPARGIGSVNAYLTAMGTAKSFTQVFADWLVSNELNDPNGGLYSYGAFKVPLVNPVSLNASASVSDTLPQFGARYYSLPVTTSQGLALSFHGQPQVPLINQPPPSGNRCWWSNLGDSIDSTLTGRFALPAGKPATLDYSLWYDTEKGWDFAYVEASADGGQTWDILQGRRTIPPDSLHNAFGPGYTGSSSGWVKDSVDLSKYAGESILVRFEYVTDESLHGQGVCLDDTSLSASGFFDDAESDTGFWDAQGFIRASYQVPQQYLLRLVQTTSSGSTVTSVPVMQDGSASTTLPPAAGATDTAVLIITAENDMAMQPASFKLEVTGK